MTRYVVETITLEGESVLALRDTASGAHALLWPAGGNNCFSIALCAPGTQEQAGAGGGGLVTVVQAPPSLDEIRRRASFWGIPLLFPFAGRLPGGEYEFEGQRRRFGVPDQPAPAAQPREDHGFAMGLPWRVVATDADDERAQVHSALTSLDRPETLDGYPFPYTLETLYRLDRQGVQLRIRVTNTGAGNLPFGAGAHPYLHLPLGPHGAPEDCLVHVPAARRWDWLGLRDRALQGAAGSWDVSRDAVCPPVDQEYDRRTPRPFGEARLTAAYTDLTLIDDHVQASVRDPANGLEVVMRASPAFTNVVYWSPPGRPEICLEPWSCPPFAFLLAARGVPHHGITVLGPGQTWQGSMRLALRAVGPAGITPEEPPRSPPPPAPPGPHPA